MHETMNEFITSMVRKRIDLLSLAMDPSKSTMERFYSQCKADGIDLVIQDFERKVSPSQEFLAGKIAGFDEAINILSKVAGDEDFIHASIVMALQNQVDALRELTGD